MLSRAADATDAAGAIGNDQSKLLRRGADLAGKVIRKLVRLPLRMIHIFRPPPDARHMIQGWVAMETSTHCDASCRIRSEEPSCGESSSKEFELAALDIS